MAGLASYLTGIVGHTLADPKPTLQHPYHIWVIQIKQLFFLLRLFLFTALLVADARSQLQVRRIIIVVLALVRPSLLPVLLLLVLRSIHVPFDLRRCIARGICLSRFV